MKTPQLIITTIIIVALAAFGFAEWRQVKELTRQIAQLREEAASQAANAKEEEAKLQQQIEDRKDVIAQMEEQRKTIASNDAATDTAVDGAAKPKPPGNELGGMLKKMFTDPNSKKMMRNMQMMGVKMMYSDLAKELGLKPDQANQVMELLGDRQMALTTKGMKMFGGDSGEAASADEVGKEVEAAKEDYDEQLESILGKDGMAKLSEFEKSVGERMQIQQYKQAFAANGVPLDDNESQGLLTIMKEERAQRPPSPLDPGSKDVGAAMQAMQSEETVSKLIAEQEAVDQRVLSRARNVLSPDKMAQFQGIQKSVTDMQKAQLDMARTFMAPSK